MAAILGIYQLCLAAILLHQPWFPKVSGKAGSFPASTVWVLFYLEKSRVKPGHNHPHQQRSKQVVLLGVVFWRSYSAMLKNTLLTVTSLQQNDFSNIATSCDLYCQCYSAFFFCLFFCLAGRRKCCALAKCDTLNSANMWTIKFMWNYTINPPPPPITGWLFNFNHSIFIWNHLDNYTEEASH